MFILVLILKWLYASLVGAEAGEVKFSLIFKTRERERDLQGDGDRAGDRAGVCAHDRGGAVHSLR